MDKVGQVIKNIKSDAWILVFEHSPEHNRMYAESLNGVQVISLTADEYRFVWNILGDQLANFETRKTGDSTVYLYTYPERIPDGNSDSSL